MESSPDPFSPDVLAVVDRWISGPGDRALVVLTAEGRIDHRSHEMMPAASLAKIPVVWAAQRELPPEFGASVSDVLRTDAPSILRSLGADRVLDRDELCGLAIEVSDNDTSNTLLHALPTGALDRALADLGMRSTVIGADFSDGALADHASVVTTTASDVTSALDHVLRAPQGNDLRRWLGSNLMTSRIAAETRGAVSHKTGSLAGVVNDAGVVHALDGSEAFMLVTLTCEQPWRPDTSSATARLAHDLEQLLLRP